MTFLDTSVQNSVFLAVTNPIFYGWLDGWFEVQTEPDMDFLKLTYKNAAVLQHFWAKSIQRFHLRLGVC